MILYYGGGLNPPPTHLSLCADEAFAGGFAKLHESPLWKVTLRLRPSDILDVTDCGFDAAGVAIELRATGIQASDPEPAQAQFPPAVIRTIPENGIQHAGYRAIQLRD